MLLHSLRGKLTHLRLRMFSGAAVLSVGLAFVGIALLSSPASAGWTLQWSDEFNGAAGQPPNPANWNYEIGGGGWGNNELEYYTNSTNNVATDGNGHLVITAIQQAMGGEQYTSARLDTMGKVQPQYGLIEASIKVPYSQGVWPAFWMLGSNFNQVGWPNCGEIDIMESIGRTPNTLYGTIHGPGYADAGIGYTYNNATPLSDDYHVYAVQWSENNVQWFIDGVQYGQATPANMPNGGQWVFNQPFYILLNFAVGGNFPGNPDSTSVFPQQMLIDYVRVYSATSGTSSPSVPQNLTAQSVTSTGAMLNWTASTNPNGPIAGYNIYQNGTQIGTTTDTTYAVTGLTASTTYNFTVAAFDGLGNVSAQSAPVSVTTSAAPPPPPPSACAGPTLFLLSGGGLCATPGTAQSTVTIPSAGGVNHDGTPTNPVTFTVTGVNGTYSGAPTNFTFYVDSGTAIANGIQARVSYDFNGDGVWDRVETYNYFATAPLAVWQAYTPAVGIKSATGNFQNFNNGTVQVELWSAIGNASSIVSVSSPSSSSAQSVIEIPVSTTPPPPPPPSSCAGYNLFLRSAGSLCATAGSTPTTVTIPSAGGVNHDGTPTNPVTFTVTGINGTYSGAATNFTFYVDSGTSIANGIQAQISYDFNGDGVWDRVETYHYFATDPLPGWEAYTPAQGLESATGSFQNFTNGKVQVQLWSAIGNASSTVSVDSPNASQAPQSILNIPFS